MAARECGFRTAYVWRRQEFGPHFTADLPPQPQVDLVAEDFNDLATRLGC
jgi:2-haloacid dehalogenase